MTELLPSSPPPKSSPAPSRALYYAHDSPPFSRFANKSSFIPKQPLDVVTLDLRHQGKNDRHFSEKLFSLSPSLSKTGLLLLSHNQFEKQSISFLTKNLTNNNSVKHLILSHCSLPHFAVAALADLLKVNRFIGWLVLNNSQLDDIATKTLALGLRKNKGLSYLVLNDNEISDEGLLFLLESLKEHPQLKGFFIHHNPIGQSGIKALISFIQSQPQLEKLSISFTEDIAKNLSEKLLLTAEQHDVDIVVHS